MPCDFPGLWCEVVVRDLMNQLAVETVEIPEGAVTQSYCASQDGFEHRLHVGRRAGDDAQDFRGGGLLFERFCFALERLRLALDRFGLALQRLRQLLLKVGDSSAFRTPRALGDEGLGFALSLRGLCTPTHQPLLHRPMVGARLRLGGPREQGGVAPYSMSSASADLLRRIDPGRARPGRRV